MTELLLRSATIDDLELLQHWDEQPHVIASDPNDDWHWQRELVRTPDWREQLIAEAKGTPIAFVQIIDPVREESHYWGDCAEHLRAVDIWLGESAHLGQGFGTRIMALTIERCFAEPVEAILVDPLESNTRAHVFYERIGFERVERRSFGEDDCIVYRLDRSRWELPGSIENRALERIRDAFSFDCTSATELCLRSKRHWGYDEVFMARSRNALILTPERLASWTVRLAESSRGDLTGIAAVSVERGPKEAELELMFVNPDFMGQGIGRALMTDIVLRLKAKGVDTLWILSDPGAEPFYLRMGALRVGHRPSHAIPGRLLPWLKMLLA